MLITANFGAGNGSLSTVGYQVLNADKTEYAARTTTGVTELVATSGNYGVQVADATLGGRTVVWDTGGTSPAYATEAFPDIPALTAAVITNAAGVDIAADIIALKAETVSILEDTGTTIPAAIPTAVANADALLGRNIAGGSSTGRLVKDALRALRNKVAISAGTLTVYEEDDTTAAWTGAVTSEATADNITAIDPA